MTPTKRRKRPVKAATRHAKLRKEGIAALGGYDVVLAQQGGGCAICGRPPKPGGLRLNIDHDHVTGNVRGLLCAPCNRMLGWARDRRAVLSCGATYLQYGNLAACAYRDAWVTP